MKYMRGTSNINHKFLKGIRCQIAEKARRVEVASTDKALPEPVSGSSLPLLLVPFISFEIPLLVSSDSLPPPAPLISVEIPLLVSDSVRTATIVPSISVEIPLVSSIPVGYEWILTYPTHPKQLNQLSGSTELFMPLSFARI
jgi:hypothetical protein